MPAYQYLQAVPQEDTGQLQEQLDRELAECTEALPTHRNKLRAFMAERGIWHISGLDYPARAAYEQFLKGQFRSMAFMAYLKAMDLVKLHSIKSQVRAVKEKGKTTTEYRDGILFLPYHPDPEIAGRFINSLKKNGLVWDFGQKAPEKMKRQIFDSLHYVIENYSGDQLLVHLRRLKGLYGFCTDRGIGDIDGIEIVQAGEFEKTMQTSGEKSVASGIIDLCRKALFMQTAEIRWDANVWYMERLHLQPERINQANLVKELSFLEVTHKGNRELLKKYMRYGIGVTNLSVSALRTEMIWVRNFLSEIGQTGQEDIRGVTGKQMEEYFLKLSDKGLQPKSYNAQIMSIQHFFNFLIARGYIERAPFCVDYYLKKVVPKHNDRCVEAEVWAEILRKLPCFPEDIRLMYLHLWGIGLRISEVCTLKGDAYYIQGKDAWVQVYQTKMRSYKRIPIPYALYRLMTVYLKKHQIGPDEYAFQSSQGKAYRSATFRMKMQECCEKNGIKGGEYIFRSHDYRHGIATLFYDSGVSLQGVRDYMGHVYEEMTQQYVDYMPRKMALHQFSPELFLASDTAQLDILIAQNSSGKGIFLIVSATITLFFALAASIPAARYAAKISPVVAMCGVNTTQIRRRKRTVKKVRNFESYYALLNLKRNYRRTAITILSLVMSITVFVTLQGFVSLLDVSSHSSGTEHVGDYCIVNEMIGFSNDDLKKIQDSEQVETVAAKQFSMYQLDAQNHAIGIEVDYVFGQSGEWFQIAGLNDVYLEKYFGKRLSKEQIEMLKAGTGCIVRNPIPLNIEGMEFVWSNISAGSTLTIEGTELPVIGTLDGYDGYISVGNNGFTNGVQVIVNDSLYSKLTGKEVYAELRPILKAEADREAFDYLLEELCDAVVGTTYISYEQTDQQLEESFEQINLLAWGLILFIGLIGILNIINTVYTNIHTRVSEIGMQRAIGMDVAGLYRMFLWEGAYYGIFAAVIGCVLGYIFTFFVEAAANNKFQLISKVPVVPMAEATIVSVAACLLATCVPLQKIAKMSIVDSIETGE